MAMVRTFVAIELPREVAVALEELQRKLKRGPGAEAGRWVQPQGIHLTLSFLGDVPIERIQEISLAVERCCQGHAQFGLVIGNVGCFPSLRRPRVIWVGLHGAIGPLSALQHSVEAALQRLGYPPEGRPYSPHLTLARVRQEAHREAVEALAQTVAGARIEDLACFTVDAVSVLKSDLRPGGAVYTLLSRALLIGSGAG